MKMIRMAIFRSRSSQNTTDDLTRRGQDVQVKLAHQGCVILPGKAAIDLRLEARQFMIGLARFDMGLQQPMARARGLLEELGAFSGSAARRSS